MMKLVTKQDEFTDWSTLAKEDPKAFEAKREELIEEFIQNAPARLQQRLRGLQWRIDRVREKAKTPLAACIAISEMMWDSFYQLHELHCDLEKPIVSGGKIAPKSLPNADILPFRVSR